MTIILQQRKADFLYTKNLPTELTGYGLAMAMYACSNIFFIFLTVPTVSFTEEEYTVAEESGEVTVCLVMNIDVITTTEAAFGVTLSTSDGPLAIGAYKIM